MFQLVFYCFEPPFLESGGNAHAANENSNGSFDVGLWQINSGNWKAWYNSGYTIDCSLN